MKTTEIAPSLMPLIASPLTLNDVVMGFKNLTWVLGLGKKVRGWGRGWTMVARC